MVTSSHIRMTNIDKIHLKCSQVCVKWVIFLYRTVVHYGQEVASGTFQAYDHGKHNEEFYGQATPPLYSLDIITAPVATYWSLNDWLADPSVNLQTVF